MQNDEMRTKRRFLVLAAVAAAVLLLAAPRAPLSGDLLERRLSALSAPQLPPQARAPPRDDEEHHVGLLHLDASSVDEAVAAVAAGRKGIFLAGDQDARASCPPRGFDAVVKPGAAAPCRPFVAVLVPVTSGSSRTEESELDTSARVVEQPLFTHLLPSMARTLAASADAGYDVAMYVGFDKGDRLWDSAAMRPKAAALALAAAQPTLTKAPPRLRVTLLFVRCNSKNMVQASNCIAKRAHDDGASYSYRINDDTELLATNWVGRFTSALQSMRPPNVGVLGPTSDGDYAAEMDILTYDFTHRTHLLMFGWHYPPSMANWWCDNWVTDVYGDRAGVARGQVVHHTREDGRRYHVEGSPALLKDELAKGRAVLNLWLNRTGHIWTPRVGKLHAN